MNDHKEIEQKMRYDAALRSVIIYDIKFQEADPKEWGDPFEDTYYVNSSIGHFTVPADEAVASAMRHIVEEQSPQSRELIVELIDRDMVTEYTNPDTHYAIGFDFEDDEPVVSMILLGHDDEKIKRSIKVTDIESLGWAYHMKEIYRLLDEVKNNE